MTVEKVKNLSSHIGKFTKGVAWISFVCVIAMMLMNVIDVIMGYVASKHVLGAYELTQRLLMCAVFTSFAYGQSKKTHINMTIVIARFPRALRFILFTLMSILSIIALPLTTLLLTYYQRYVIKSKQTKENIPQPTHQATQQQST